MSPPSMTRWCPTPEQVTILEEMYRGGIRTPNAGMIQDITAHLSNYGRVEGKNVFYWFQNHKARDRQRFRRTLSKQLHLHHHLHRLQYLGSSPITATFNGAPASFLPHPRGYKYVQAVDNNYTCEKHTEHRDGNNTDETEMRRYKLDMAMMMIVEMPYATARPTKTLQLFPLIN